MNRVYVCPWCASSRRVLVSVGEEYAVFKRACSACPPWPSAETMTSTPGSKIEWSESMHHFPAPFAGLTRQDLEWELHLLELWLTSPHFPRDNSPQQEAHMSELLNRIAELRAKSIADKITDAELQEALRLIRQDRVSAATTSAKSRAKKSAAPMNVEALASAFGLGL